MDPKMEELKGSIGKIRNSFQGLVPAKGKTVENEDATMKFLIGELDSVLSEVDNLDRAVALGIPLTEYEGNISKLSNVEGKLKKLEENMNSLIDEMHDVKRVEEDLQSMLNEGISERQVRMLQGRIKNLEELHEKLMSGKSTKVVMELVQVIDMLNGRVKRLEELVKIAGAETPGKNWSARQPQPEAPKKQGFFDKLKSLFGR